MHVGFNQDLMTEQRVYQRRQSVNARIQSDVGAAAAAAAYRPPPFIPKRPSDLKPAVCVINRLPGKCLFSLCGFNKDKQKFLLYDQEPSVQVPKPALPPMSTWLASRLSRSPQTSSRSNSGEDKMYLPL